MSASTHASTQAETNPKLTNARLYSIGGPETTTHTHTPDLQLHQLNKHQHHRLAEVDVPPAAAAAASAAVAAADVLLLDPLPPFFTPEATCATTVVASTH